MDRKRAELERIFKSIWESVEDLIYVTTVGGDLLFANPAFYELLGYDQKEYQGAEQRWEHIPEEDREALANRLKEFLSSVKRKSGHIQNRFIKDSGEIIWIETTATKLDLKDETCVLFISRDITERKRTEEELRRSERKYRDLVERISDVIYAIDESGWLTYVSPAIESFIGYSPSEAIGRHVREFIYQDDLPQLRENFESILAGNSAAAEYRVLTKSGEIRWMRTSSQPAFSGEKVTGIYGVLADITDAKRIEEALHQSKRKIESLHQTARRLMACENEAEVYRWTVEAAERILDFSICTLDLVEEGKLVVKATSSQIPAETSRDRNLVEGLAGKTYRTGKTYVFGSLEEVPEAVPARGDFKSGISAPIGEFGIFQVASTEPGAFTSDDAQLLELLLGHTEEALKRIRLEVELRHKAIHDPLTGVYNRYYLSEILEREIKRARRYGHSLAFVMIDINRFKEINDRFGHQIGDKVIQAVAASLLEKVRESDIVIRYGGDEFLIILTEKDESAEVVEQRIAENAASVNEIKELVDFPVTLSMGMARWNSGGPGSVEEILSEADKRMYKDKRGKREIRVNEQPQEHGKG